MEKRELKKRVKGLYYCIDSWGNWDSAAPTTLEPGDEIYFKYSGGILEVYMDGRLKETNTPDIPGSGSNHYSTRKLYV